MCSEPSDLRSIEGHQAKDGSVFNVHTVICWWLFFFIRSDFFSIFSLFLCSSRGEHDNGFVKKTIEDKVGRCCNTQQWNLWDIQLVPNSVEILNKNTANLETCHQTSGHWTGYCFHHGTVLLCFHLKILYFRRFSKKETATLGKIIPLNIQHSVIRKMQSLVCQNNHSFPFAYRKAELWTCVPQTIIFLISRLSCCSNSKKAYLHRVFKKKKKKDG